MSSFGSQLKNVEKMTQIIQLLKETSILIPVIRIGDEYVLNWNPLFIAKVNMITGGNNKPNGYIFPEFRYKNGVFFLKHISEDETSVSVRISKNTDGKAIGEMNIQDTNMNRV